MLELYTTKQAARRVLLTPRTVRRYCASRFVGTMVGGRYVLTRADVAKLLRKLRHVS